MQTTLPAVTLAALCRYHYGLLSALSNCLFTLIPLVQFSVCPEVKNFGTYHCVHWSIWKYSSVTTYMYYTLMHALQIGCYTFTSSSACSRLQVVHIHGLRCSILITLCFCNKHTCKINDLSNYTTKWFACIIYLTRNQFYTYLATI